jgi:hypothetical protein
MEQDPAAALIYLNFLETFTSQISELSFFTHHYRIAQDVLCIRATRLSDLTTFETSIRHMAVEGEDASALLYLINRSELPKDMVLPKFPFLYFENEKLHFYFNSESGNLEIFDKENTIFYFLANNPSESFTVFSSSNLYFLKPILNNLGYVNMHGAVLGRNGHGIFLTNKGGSGKSTLMAFCASHKMETLGDDFLTMKPVDSSLFYSLYRQFKIAQSSPSLKLVSEKFPRLGEIDGKEVFVIEGESEPIFKPQMRITEILIPVLGEQLRIVDISKEEALKRILASTLFLNWKIEIAIATVIEMLETLPFALLELTPDLEAAYQLLDQRLSN